MKSKKWLYLTLFIIITGLLARIALTLFAEPWIGNKLETKLSDKNPNILINIENVHISIITAGINFERIKISSKNKNGKDLSVTGQIGYVRIKGFNILKFLITKEIKLKSVTISNSVLEGIVSASKKTKKPLIIPKDIIIKTLLFDVTDLYISSAANSSVYSVKKGVIKVYDLHLIKNDTLSGEIINRIDFNAKEFKSVTADSIYSYILRDLSYSSYSKVLSADSFFIHPNFTNYRFASLYDFQKDRIEIILSNIKAIDINAGDFIKSRLISTPRIKIGNMEIKVFRDKRKEFRHINKKTFQDLIYSYPGLLRLDTISIAAGNITYAEHAENANDPGYITFNNINARILNITNDSVFLNKKVFLELRCSALLMEEGKIDILLQSRLFDNENTFTVKGTLSDLNISEMNPYLENSAHVFITSGRLDRMDFNFTATNTKSNGTMTMFYNGLNLSVTNKNTGDTTAFKERLITAVANIKVLDSNPLPGKETREGRIEYERDPEKFLFSYCAKSILSGVKSSLVKNRKN